MASATLGTDISQVEVTNVSKHGFWLLLDDEELFLPFTEFPWFKDASIGKLLNDSVTFLKNNPSSRAPTASTKKVFGNERRREMNYDDFFRCAFGKEAKPYKWQSMVASEGLPQVLPVPTGLGKTEGVVLAWAWRGLSRSGTSRCILIVHCLPMRTLVRQTVERLQSCFEALRVEQDVAVDVFELMGGSIDEEWARWPDKPWVLVGTQDQLLSRAMWKSYRDGKAPYPALAVYLAATHHGKVGTALRATTDDETTCAACRANRTSSISVPNSGRSTSRW